MYLYIYILYDIHILCDKLTSKSPLSHVGVNLKIPPQRFNIHHRFAPVARQRAPE